MVQKRPKLEVMVKDKILSLDGSKLKLNDSFYDAEASQIENGPEIELKLIYQGESEVPEKEMERIYSHIEGQGYNNEGIGVFSGSEDYPNITLVGDLEVEVYRI